MAMSGAIAGVRAGAAASAATDDEILGIETRSGKANGSGAATAPNHDAAASGARGNGAASAEMRDAAADPSAAKDAPAGKESGAQNAGEQEAQAAIAEPPELKAVFDANPELRRAWRDEKAYREIFPTVEAAREMQKIFPTVEDARAAGQQLTELAQLDALFFSNRPEAHAELARFVQRIDPQAFRSLARAMAQMPEASAAPGLSPAQDPPRNAAEAKDAAPKGGVAQDERQSQADAEASRRASSEQEAARQNAFAAFYQEANAGAVQGVIDAIQTQVERLLPEGVATGARNRVIGEIYREPRRHPARQSRPCAAGAPRFPQRQSRCGTSARRRRPDRGPRSAGPADGGEERDRRMDHQRARRQHSKTRAPTRRREPRGFDRRRRAWSR